MACKCPEFDKETGKNFFEHKCGTDIFGTFYKKWDPDFEKYLNQINGIKDPILRYISIYFVQYYIDGYHYYRQSDPIPRYAACQYLTLWLQEKKDLFTYGGKHEKNKELWDTNFKALWNKLESNYLIKDGKEQKPWCKYFELSGLTDFHPRVTLTISEESTSQKPSISYSPPPPVETQCNCTPCEMPDNSPKMDPSPQMDLTLQTDQAPAADRTKNLAVTSGFTAVGTLGTLFFLYRFTPMISWFRRPGMNNIGTDLYMDPGAPDGFLSMQHGNGNNNIFYQP